MSNGDEQAETQDQHIQRRETTFKRALNADTFSGLANALYGNIVDQYSNQFYEIRNELNKANINVLFRTYVSQMMLASTLAFISTFLAVTAVTLILSLDMLLTVVLIITTPTIVSIFVFVGMWFYPSQRAGSRATAIDNDLPFALNQMSAVASSGIPPSSMFKLLTDFEEYDEISQEAEKIIKKIEIFGEDITTALREVAQESPSEDFKEILYGMLSTIETGGNLDEFLEEQADSALFDYKLRREKQIERLSTFASFYTALLVAAPLFLIAVLAVMNLIGGGLFGFRISELMNLGVYVIIPAINTLFIIVLQVTQGDM
ncbi:MAG: type II secretion system F family protein [Candidatus Nanohaloarchaea archaeon]|nr:type II secretion system F family protein [Candidatus Nanohaloarchaea archaeon]